MAIIKIRRVKKDQNLHSRATKYYKRAIQEVAASHGMTYTELIKDAIDRLYPQVGILTRKYAKEGQSEEDKT